MARTEYADVSPEVVARLRAICLDLPETIEEPAWTGTRWRIRTRTFAHVFALDGEHGPTTMVAFRAEGEELDALRSSGHPFFYLGWGRDAIGMVLDAGTDWDEVGELMTESYCVLAPKKLVALVPRPET